jgi:hypothetical protein
MIHRASPISRVRQVAVPTEDEVLAGVSISQNIAVAVAEASTGDSIEAIDGVNSAFDSIYGIVNHQPPALDGTPWPVDRMSLLPPIDQVICMILQCDRGGMLARAATNEANTTSPPTPSLPALLDPASALEEIRGWAEGSLDIGPARGHSHPPLRHPRQRRDGLRRRHRRFGRALAPAVWSFNLAASQDGCACTP